jgi:hypothetical protein
MPPMKDTLPSLRAEAKRRAGEDNIRKERIPAHMALIRRAATVAVTHGGLKGGRGGQAETDYEPYPPGAELPDGVELSGGEVLSLKISCCGITQDASGNVTATSGTIYAKYTGSVKTTKGDPTQVVARFYDLVRYEEDGARLRGPGVTHEADRSSGTPLAVDQQELAVIAGMVEFVNGAATARAAGGVAVQG